MDKMVCLGEGRISPRNLENGLTLSIRTLKKMRCHHSGNLLHYAQFSVSLDKLPNCNLSFLILKLQN
jgi:hypothetical protein